MGILHPLLNVNKQLRHQKINVRADRHGVTGNNKLLMMQNGAQFQKTDLYMEKKFSVCVPIAILFYCQKPQF
jgi:hypothetical protein